MTEICASLPDWVEPFLHGRQAPASVEGRLRLVIDLSRENVTRQAGGPFGAAVFSTDGELLSVGVNSVVRLSSSLWHAETLAIALAQVHTKSYLLTGGELYISCDPCAMCVGAIAWSGITHIFCAASRQDAEAAGFDEGPVFPETYGYLAERGVTFSHGILRDDAAAVLARYRSTGGQIYGPR